MQETYRTKTLVAKGGKLSIKGLPFRGATRGSDRTPRKEVQARRKISIAWKTLGLSRTV